jgi:hypothetical protein
MSRFVHFELAVYLPPAKSTTRSEPMRALAESLRDYPGLRRVSDLPKEPQTMLVRAYLNENIRLIGGICGSSSHIEYPAALQYSEFISSLARIAWPCAVFSFPAVHTMRRHRLPPLRVVVVDESLAGTRGA